MQTNMSKAQAYRIIGWIAIGYAVFDILKFVFNIADINKITADEQAKSIILTIIGVVVGINAVLYVLAGIAGIKLNFKLGKTMFVLLTIMAVIYFAGMIISKSFTWTDVTNLLVPAIYGTALFPAIEEADGASKAARVK